MEEVPITPHVPVHSTFHFTALSVVKEFRTASPEAFQELYIHEYLAPRCPGVVPVLNTQIHLGTVSLTLFPCPSLSFADLLTSPSPPLYPEPQLLAFMSTMLQTLTQIHSFRIALRNIDLSNWLFHPQNGIFLTDFGESTLIPKENHEIGAFLKDIKALGVVFLELTAQKRFLWLNLANQREISELVLRKCSEKGYSRLISDLILHLFYDCSDISRVNDDFFQEKTLPNSAFHAVSVDISADLTEETSNFVYCRECSRITDSISSFLVCKHSLCALCLHGSVTKLGFLCVCGRVTTLKDVQNARKTEEKVVKYALKLLQRERK